MTSPELAQSSPPQVSNGGFLPLWRWWTGELKAMMPRPMAIWLEGDTLATNVSVDESGLTIINAGADGARPPLPRRVPNEAIANHPLLRELVSTGRDRVRLVLSPDQAMVKTITLPIATEENLREVVGFELDRHTPFTPSQAYYDVQVLKRDAAQEKITVSLSIASKSEVAALLETLRRAGLTCTAVGIEANSAGNAIAVDLQPAGDKPPRRLGRRHQVNLGLLCMAILLLIVAIVLPIWQKREAVKVLIPQAEKTGAEFKLSERVYADYVKLAGEYNFLAAKKHAVYPVLTLIEELAQTFPDTTWVQKLDIKASGKLREVIIMGEAQSASKVIENLEQSPQTLFQNSKQLRPTSKMQANTEGFYISAEVKPRPVPAAVSFEDAPLPSVGAPAVTGSPSPAVVPNLPEVGSAASVSALVQPDPATVTGPSTAKSNLGPALAPGATPPVQSAPAQTVPATKTPSTNNPLVPKRVGS